VGISKVSENRNEALPNVRTAVVDGIGMGSGGDGGGDAFTATGEKKSIADILKRFAIVDVDGCK
jgi:hypothetical protein